VVSTVGRDEVDGRELWENFGELPILGLYVDQCRSTLGFPPCAEHSQKNQISMQLQHMILTNHCFNHRVTVSEFLQQVLSDFSSSKIK